MSDETADPGRHIVIVGAGHAGGSAAQALRAAGHQGPITLVGQESHPPYERPPLSKELLAGVMPVEKTYLRPHAYYGENGITLRLGESVVAIDRPAQRVELAGGEAIPYDSLLLTMGARARRLPALGDGPRLHYLRDIADTLSLREKLGEGVRVAVVGAGFIGLEVAATARKHDASVTLLEYAPHPLGRVVPREVGAHFAALHRSHGVDLRTGTSVAGAEETGTSLRIRATDGSVVEADLVVVGIGAVPNTELAAAAGLAVDDGIVVDEFGRTNDPNIFAAGDVTRHFNPLLGRPIRLEAWQNAQNQAAAVAKVMAGGTEAFSEIPWFWSDQYDVNLQMAGAPEQWEDLVWRGAPPDPSFTLFGLSDGVPVAAITVAAPREMRFARQLVARGRKIDASALADKAIKLQDLAR